MTSISPPRDVLDVTPKQGRHVQLPFCCFPCALTVPRRLEIGHRRCRRTSRPCSPSNARRPPVAVPQFRTVGTPEANRRASRGYALDAHAKGACGGRECPGVGNALAESNQKLRVAEARTASAKQLATLA